MCVLYIIYIYIYIYYICVLYIYIIYLYIIYIIYIIYTCYLRVAKRQRTVTDTNVDLLDFASTTKLVEVPIDVINNYEVIKLDRVTDKSDRYQSHKDFLLECIREKVIPMGLRINLAPTIGDNNDEFMA